MEKKIIFHQIYLPFMNYFMLSLLVDLLLNVIKIIKFYFIFLLATKIFFHGSGFPHQKLECKLGNLKIKAIYINSSVFE